MLNSFNICSVIKEILKQFYVKDCFKAVKKIEEMFNDVWNSISFCKRIINYDQINSFNICNVIKEKLKQFYQSVKKKLKKCVIKYDIYLVFVRKWYNHDQKITSNFNWTLVFFN